MKLIAILSTVLLITACDSISKPQHEQSFICKSLINGYLQAQQLGQYKFHQQINQRESSQYIYVQPTVGGMVLGIHQASQLQFECTKSSQNTYYIFVIDRQAKKEPILKFHALEKI